MLKGMMISFLLNIRKGYGFYFSEVPMFELWI